MKWIKNLLSVLFVFLIVLPLSAQEERTIKRKVAIGRFSNETQYAKGLFYDKENDPMRKRVAMENQNIKKRVRRLVKSMGWEVQPSCTWCRHSFATNLTHAGVPHNYISESMGHSVDSNITNRYIDAFPLAQQMEFNSRLLKLNDDTDILEELKGLTPEQLKVLIALAKNA